MLYVKKYEKTVKNCLYEKCYQCETALNISIKISNKNFKASFYLAQKFQVGIFQHF